MKETEITVELFEDIKFIDKKLKEQGFAVIEKFQLNDWYYSKRDDVLKLTYSQLIDSSFLVREIVTNHTKYELCFKKKEYDKLGNVIAEEKVKTEISDLDSCLKIFKLVGLNNYCIVENSSTVYKKGNIEFAIQNINGLGVFLELEEDTSMSAMSSDEKFAYLADIVKGLGLKIGNDFSCKKVFMMLHK